MLFNLLKKKKVRETSKLHTLNRNFETERAAEVSNTSLKVLFTHVRMGKMKTETVSFPTTHRLNRVTNSKQKFATARMTTRWQCYTTRFFHIAMRGPEECVCFCYYSMNAMKVHIHTSSYATFLCDSPQCWCWICRSAGLCGHWSCCRGFSWQSWGGLGCHWPPVAPTKGKKIDFIRIMTISYS